MKWFMTMTVAGMSLAGLAWPTTATLPMTQILLEDGSPYYVPVTATAVSGSPIRWANPTPTHHTVTHSGCLDDSIPCAFDSGMLPPGSTFTLPGLPPGHYAYYCRIHPIMRGALTVTDDTATPSQL
ncbi:MAG: cupredoxin domain-containing protein [Nitrospiraceae bacterium]